MVFLAQKWTVMTRLPAGKTITYNQFISTGILHSSTILHIVWKAGWTYPRNISTVRYVNKKSHFKTTMEKVVTHWLQRVQLSHVSPNPLTRLRHAPYLDLYLLSHFSGIYTRWPLYSLLFKTKPQIHLQHTVIQKLNLQWLTTCQLSVKTKHIAWFTYSCVYM